MTNHTNTKSTNLMIHKYPTKNRNRHSTRYDRRHSTKKHRKRNHRSLNSNISPSNSHKTHSTSYSHKTHSTTNSYYSPQSESSECQSMQSLSPLSIDSTNVYSNYRKYHFMDKQCAKFSLQVFVAMHTTRQLSWFTQHEAWGDKNSLLFKYLDYTFRCAAFRDEVYTFDVDDDDGSSRLVFNTGLIARSSGHIIYLMLTPNQKKSVAQQWRVGYGDPYNRYNSSFVSGEWLLHNVITNGNIDLLPKQFKLNMHLFNEIKHKFSLNKLQICADFDHIVTKYWDRIIGEYNKRSALISIPSKEETISLLTDAFDAVQLDKAKHELLTPMLYVDSHNTQHSVEYMVPLPIHVDNNETIWFAAALVSRERNHAQLMSILSADMAYSNARLIGGVTTPWLKKLAPPYHKLESQLSHRVSPILVVYHIKQEDDDAVERFLYCRFSKYGKIVSIDVSLLSSPNKNDLNPSDEFSASIRFVNSHSVIDAYNGTMDALNRGIKVGFELDFELINNNNNNSKNSNNNDHYLCQFCQIFCRPHILPPPEQLLSNNDIGPFYPHNTHTHLRKEYYELNKNGNEWNILSDSLRSYGIKNIKYIKRFINNDNHGTTAWYQTSRNLALQIANNGFIFKFMNHFSKLMDTSGFKFETNPRISNDNHLFQCKLRLTDKQKGYLRHNANIIITDTRIIKPNYWIVLKQ